MYLLVILWYNFLPNFIFHNSLDLLLVTSKPESTQNPNRKLHKIQTGSHIKSKPEATQNPNRKLLKIQTGSYTKFKPEATQNPNRKPQNPNQCCFPEETEGVCPFLFIIYNGRRTSSEDLIIRFKV